MSEYQYYDFRAIDRPLSADQMKQLRGISSRAEITPVSFISERESNCLAGKPYRTSFCGYRVAAADPL
jgi:hypothetical protein